MAYVESKVCSTCNNNKDLSEYHRRSDTKDGLRHDCKACAAIYQAKRRNGPKREKLLNDKKEYHRLYPEVKRAGHLKHKYNMTLEDYNNKLESQNGSCAICGANTPNNNQHKHLYVDHNHVTNKVRGLLCHPCNTTIGACQEDIERLIKCAEYLKAYNG